MPAAHCLLALGWLCDHLAKGSGNELWQEHSWNDTELGIDTMGIDTESRISQAPPPSGTPSSYMET